jgi:hypothetical protein
VTKKAEPNPGEYKMYWIQDASAEKDDEGVASVNQYLADLQSAAPVDSSSGVGSGDGAGGSGTGTMDTDDTDGASGGSAGAS